MDIQAYLERINYYGITTPTIQTLRALQWAHLLTVPFENLSVHAKEEIILTDDALFDKVVTRRRGGFCYELNGLFSALLRTLGFNVTKLSAGVSRGEGKFGPDFDHMTLMISLDERWLVDVGFGDSFRLPLRLDDPDVQQQHGRAYQLVPDGEKLILMEQKAGEEWNPQFRLSLQAYQYPDYVDRCHYHQTSPQSTFTKGRICTRATPDGRLTLGEKQFITTSLSGERQEQEVAEEEEYTQLLWKHFGIVMTLEE